MIHCAMDAQPMNISDPAMDAIVNEIVGMGFAQNRAEKAAFFTKKAGVQQALDWYAPPSDRSCF